MSMDIEGVIVTVRQTRKDFENGNVTDAEIIESGIAFRWEHRAFPVRYTNDLDEKIAKGTVRRYKKH